MRVQGLSGSCCWAFFIPLPHPKMDKQARAQRPPGATCLLCGKPEPSGLAHVDCADKEQLLADQDD